MTVVQKVRVLVGNPSTSTLSDSDIQVYLDVEFGDVLLAAAMALDTLAAKADSTPHQVTIGKFQYSAGRAQIRQLVQLAEVYRQRVYDSPAFAIAKENLSEFNEAILIRNQILKSIP